MWCPEGYYTWQEAFSEICELADEITALVCMGGVPTTMINGRPGITHTGSFHLRAAKLVESQEEADIAVALFCAWLMTQFLEEFPPVAAGLGGNLIELNPVLLGHREQFEMCGLQCPMTLLPEFSNIKRWAKNGDFKVGQVFDRFTFIDAQTGLIRPKNGTK